MELRKRVAHERMMRGAMSIRQAAQLGGTSNQTWGVFEKTGTVTAAVRSAVAQAFGWNMDWPENPPPVVTLPNDVADELRAEVLALRAQVEELVSKADGLNAAQEAIATAAVESIEDLRTRVLALVEAQETTHARLDALEHPRHEGRA